MDRAITRLRNVSGLAVSISVFHSDDEVFGQQRVQGREVASLVGVVPLASSARTSDAAPGFF